MVNTSSDAAGTLFDQFFENTMMWFSWAIKNWAICALYFLFKAKALTMQYIKALSEIFLDESTVI
jgi:hypothetical protein